MPVHVIAIETDKFGMELDFLLLSAAWRIRGTAKINRVLGDKGPIPVDRKCGEVPVLHAREPAVSDMDALNVVCADRELNEPGRQAFGDQQAYCQ